MSYKSESLILNCLHQLPVESPKIIIENSGNIHLKYELEKKFNNTSCYVMKENLGYGTAANYGIKKTKTKYVFTITPDVTLDLKKFTEIINTLKKERFSIAGFLETRDNFISKKNTVLEKNFVKGFAMILNKKKIRNFFDENFFLYLEEVDLCKRVKNNNGRIVLANIKISHLGGASHGNKFDLEIEKSRNWHWMWSKFYFNRKHYSYFYAILVTLPNFVSSVIKSVLYKILNEEKKYEKYRMRLNGLLNSYFKKKSFYRPYGKID